MLNMWCSSSMLIPCVSLPMYRTAARPPPVRKDQIRPTTDYARIAASMSTKNPRFLVDNILDLGLDLFDRTTQVSKQTKQSDVKRELCCFLYVCARNEKL